MHIQTTTETNQNYGIDAQKYKCKLC